MAKRVAEAFEQGTGAGLLHLATRELNAVLPLGAAWWRELGRRYLTQLCHTPDLNGIRNLAALPPPGPAELETLAQSAPPMRGGEYLNPDLLSGLWQQLDATVRAQVEKHPQGAGAWLTEAHPLWRMVGRVSFHLAENKQHPTHPFAFMASYASRISSQSRVQHLPLGRALQEYAAAKDKETLVNLLSPVQKAAEKSALVKELVDSGRIFKPLPWSPAEAYRFLKDAAICEAAGVIVRLPDWWKGGRPPRPKVRVRVGQNRMAGGLGADTLLDFSADATLEGEPLTEAEWQSLLSAAEGLALVRGKWVEVNPEKLQEALAHWKKVEKLTRTDGLSFFEGMRLLSGFQPGGGDGAAAVEAEAEREWSGVQPGAWLDEVLASLRDPAALEGEQVIPGLQAQLRPYQSAGVKWLWLLSQLGLGGCLADDMGLGKTLQVLALLLKRKIEPGVKQAAAGSQRPSLLVVPASLLANWRAEIERFTPALSYRIVHPSEPGDMAKPLESEALSQTDLVITTYGMVTRLEALRGQEWNLVILDEAQAIKNAETRQSRAVKELKARGRFALTGTPVENRASDLWSIFDFLNPGLLGIRNGFPPVHPRARIRRARRLRTAPRAHQALHSAPVKNRQARHCRSAGQNRGARLVHAHQSASRPLPKSRDGAGRETGRRGWDPAQRAWCWPSSCASNRSAITRRNGSRTPPTRPRQAASSVACAS